MVMNIQYDNYINEIIANYNVNSQPYNNDLSI